MFKLSSLCLSNPQCCVSGASDRLLNSPVPLPVEVKLRSHAPEMYNTLNTKTVTFIPTN